MKEKNLNLCRFIGFEPNPEQPTSNVWLRTGIEKGFHKFSDMMNITDLHFHDSYDWLMPLLHDIEKRGCIVEVNYALVITCRICYVGKIQEKSINFYGENSTIPINAIYDAVTQFVEWYLKNKI